MYCAVFAGLQIEPVAGPAPVEGVGQSLRLQETAALDSGDGAVRECLFAVQGLPVLAVHHVEPVLFGEPVAVLDHFRDLEMGVYVDEGERDVSVERLAGEPQQHRGVLPDGPEHAKVVESGVRLPQDVYALGFKLVEMIHGSALLYLFRLHLITVVLEVEPELIVYLLSETLVQFEMVLFVVA